jgi:antirestriction protein ArdC
MQNYRSGSTTEDFDLRADVRKGTRVTTVIHSDRDKSVEHSSSGDGRKSSHRGGRGRWNSSVSRLTEVSSDDEGRDKEHLSS